MRRALTFVLLGSLLSLSGCLELMQGYTLNPDGSGKVVLDTITPSTQAFIPNAPAEAPEVIIKRTIEERLAKGQGIDAWSDITCKMTPEGKVHFRGTAYFSDINKLDVDNEGAGGGGAMTWTRQGDTMVLTMQNKDKDAPEGQPLTDEQVEARLQQEKAQYQQMKPMVAGMVEGLKMDITVKVPGKIAETNIFQNKDGVASLSITGKQMLTAMDRIYASDDLLRKQIKAGEGKAKEEFMTEQIFGAKGSPTVKVTGAAEPLFDYKAEVGKAKAAEAEMFKKLGVTPPAK